LVYWLLYRLCQTAYIWSHKVEGTHCIVNCLEHVGQRTLLPSSCLHVFIKLRFRLRVDRRHGRIFPAVQCLKKVLLVGDMVKEFEVLAHECPVVWSLDFNACFSSGLDLVLKGPGAGESPVQP